MLHVIWQNKCTSINFMCCTPSQPLGLLCQQVWPKRQPILTINDCNVSIMINDHLPWSDIFTLPTWFETFLKFTELQTAKFVSALQKQNPSYFSGVCSHTWLHSFFISASYYKYTSSFFILRFLLFYGIHYLKIVFIQPLLWQK